MKNLFKITLIALLISSTQLFAQDAKVVKLKQTPGEFNKKELNLKANKPYVFEVENDGVDHEVGFVIVPAGKEGQEHHIQNAYVQKMIADGEQSKSKEVVLEKGEYEYFCPMNPTPKYKLVVN